MDDKERQAAFMSALITEHFVLQAAASATVSEAGARASLYVFSLSSSLVAMGFALPSREVFLPFAITVLPAVFLLGIFTVVRLVDTGRSFTYAGTKCVTAFTISPRSTGNGDSFTSAIAPVKEP